jgi:hypothetical protein
VTLGARIVLSRRRRALALCDHPLAEILPMRRSHRLVHRVLWPILALAVALGLATAWALGTSALRGNVPGMNAPRQGIRLRPDPGRLRTGEHPSRPRLLLARS